jgi:hypothetical protein
VVSLPEAGTVSVFLMNVYSLYVKIWTTWAISQKMATLQLNCFL